MGFAIYVVVGAFGLYIIAVQNLVGTRIILTLLRNRKGLLFGADPLKRDRLHGWAPVRHALTTTYSELAVHGIALGLVGVTLPPGAITGPYLMALVQWGAVLPLYALFPFFFTRRRVENYKEKEQAKLVAELEGELAHVSPARRRELENVYRESIALIQSLPVLPFRHVKDVTVYVISLLSSLLSLWLIGYVIVSR